jgi:MerR family redox-sensitive transcriptional activator SoxR
MSSDLLSVSQTSERSGFAPSALRYYEREGLISAERTSGGQRRFHRNELRRLAFIAAARHVGLSLDEIRTALSTLPTRRSPTNADWERISNAWRDRLDREIAALEELRDGLDGCIGCGCLSLESCELSNPNDRVARRGPGAVYLSEVLRPGEDSPSS